MADTLDPRELEERSQVDQDNYKIYKRRWLVLTAASSILLVAALHRSIVSIADILNEFVDMNMYHYGVISQVSMYVNLLSVFFLARALDYFGLRRMTYVTCIILVLANCLKALCCCDEQYVSLWIKENRYYILFLSEVFVGFALSYVACAPTKVASVWFARNENTLAFVIANCGYNIGMGVSNYYTPILIKSTKDMYLLSYMFIASGIFLILIVLTCVTRSSPKSPPSADAIMSASTQVPLKKGLLVMMTHPSYLMLMITLALNNSALAVEQLVLEDVLRVQHYSDSFCGILIAHAYFFGTVFLLIGGFWIDNSANYIKVSRISSMFYGVGFAVFNISLLYPNSKNVIIATNIFVSLGSSVMYPALFQVCVRCAMTIFSEATVGAICIVLQQATSGPMMMLLTPLKKLSPASNIYQTPLVAFLLVLMLLNILYSALFKAPGRDELHNRLRQSEDEEDLVEEEVV